MQSMQRCSKLSTPQHSTASRTTITVLCTTLSVSHVVVEEFWPHPSLQNCVSSLRFDYIWLRHSFKHSSLKINSILIRLSSRLWLDLYDMLILFSFSHSKLYCQKEEEFVLMCRVWFFPNMVDVHYGQTSPPIHISFALIINSFLKSKHVTVFEIWTLSKSFIFTEWYSG